MRFEQTRTILQKLAPQYHRTVSDHFQRLADGEVSPRVQLMLDYLIDHEEHRALALGEFCHGAPHKVLDHWLKGLERNFPDVPADLLDANAGTDLDRLIKAAVSPCAAENPTNSAARPVTASRTPNAPGVIRTKVVRLVMTPISKVWK